jgi:hypothetical protein
VTLCRRIRYDTTERSGTLDEQKWSENRSLRNTIKKLIERRFGVFNIDKEGTVRKVGFYPRYSSRSDTKLSRETFTKNRMISGVKSSRHVKQSATSNLQKTRSLNEVLMNR